ncbi:unnamed protein product [Urochloa decumbens]|uniref:KIB1-4 beta-propeller domain-containing protein n=1 Tax=Urochloa decumbens TaxID=240449 RepID=A0ABC9BPH6_9POAL
MDMTAPSSKLRRLTRSDADAGKVSPDWASLAGDLVEQIGWRVLAGDLHDYVRFRAACSHWSASTPRPRGRGVADPRFHPRRWMMLPEGHGLYPGHPDLRGFVRFLNLSTGDIVRAHLPLLDDHVILDSVDGLLLLHHDRDTTIRLLHPFTGDIAELPPLTSLLPQMEPSNNSERSKRSRLMKVCTSIAVSSTGAVTVMLALDLIHRVAYATAGDQRWTLSSWELKPMLKPVSFQGKIYALFMSIGIRKVYIHQFDPPCPATKEGPSHLPLPVKIAECSMDKFLYMLNFAECGSELLLVAYDGASRSKLMVYRLADLVREKIEPITSIGNNTLFLNERCLCVSGLPDKGSMSLPSISPNSIICLHSLPVHPASVGLARFEQYDLGTGIWTPASDGDVFRRPPPSPHTLIHHIFTCCSRRYWNKGMMYCVRTDPIWWVKQDLRFTA